MSTEYEELCKILKEPSQRMLVIFNASFEDSDSRRALFYLREPRDAASSTTFRLI